MTARQMDSLEIALKQGWSYTRQATVTHVRELISRVKKLGGHYVYDEYTQELKHQGYIVAKKPRQACELLKSILLDNE